MALFLLSGKGGVGKTHLATSLAWYRRTLGRKVLLVDFSSVNQYSEFFSKKISYKPRLISKDFSVASWTGLDCLRQYVEEVLKSKKIADFFMAVPWVEAVVNTAPGLKEISVLGKLTADQRGAVGQTEFNDIIFDGPSTGHFLSLLKTPFALSSMIRKGRMKDECDSIINTLKNNEEVKFIIISEELEFSIQEQKELTQKIKAFFDEDRNVLKISNFSIESKPNHFPYLNLKGGWLDDAKSLSSRWGNLL